MKKVFGVLILQLFLFVGINQVIACSCLNGKPLIDSADAIFVGKVIAVKNNKWSVEVNKVVKGEVADTTKIKTFKDAACSWSKFELNETYVFFVDRIGKNYFETFACSLTNTLSNWNTEYIGLNFESRRKKYQDLGMSEESINELENQFYRDLEDVEKERKDFLKILEN